MQKLTGNCDTGSNANRISSLDWGWLGVSSVLAIGQSPQWGLTLEQNTQ